MAKKILQDIVNTSEAIFSDSTQSSDKQVPFSVRRSQKKDRFSFFTGNKSDINTNSTPENLESVPDTALPVEKKHTSSKGLWGIAIAIVVSLGVFGMNFFGNATIDISPRKETVNLAHTFTAQKEGEGFLYQTVVLEDTVSVEVPATGEKRVDTKASGTIEIYNTYSTKSQTLVKNTRFEDPKGRIYRIQKSVTVPGLTKQGSTVIPGKVSAVVYADFAGEEYNAEPSDFTIPGFKNDPRFDAFYARSTTPLTGGFSGVVKTVADDVLVKAKTDLKEKLHASLVEKLTAEIPAETVFYKNGFFFEITDVPQKESTDTKADTLAVEQKGVLRAVIFNAKALGTHAVQNVIPLAKDERVSVRGLAELDFVIKNKSGWNPLSAEPLSFELVGPVTVVWDVDIEALKTQFAGKKKADFVAMIAEHKNIAKAEASVRPIWKTSFPKELSKIIIKNSEQDSTDTP